MSNVRYFPLKACPFCGGNNLVLYDPKGNPGHDSWVSCRDCRCAAGMFNTEEEATKAWNTRVATMGDAATGDGAGGGVRSVDSSSPTPDNDPHWLFKDHFNPNGSVA